MDNIKALRAFMAVAERGSFTAAATHLALSTSSVSRLLADLENWLQTPLLHRTTRTLSLTQAGERYLARCADIVDAWENLQNDAHIARGVPHGTLNIAGSTHPICRLIAPLLPDFLKCYPDVRVHLHMADRAIDLIADGMDAAIRIGSLADSTLLARKCGEIATRLTASPLFLERHEPPTRAKDLESLPCLVDTISREGNVWQLDGPVRVDGPLAVNDGEIVRQMTLAGLGISLLPEFFVNEDIAAGRLVELLPDTARETRGVHILFPAHRHITPAARAFSDHVAAGLSARR